MFFSLLFFPPKSLWTPWCKFQYEGFTLSMVSLWNCLCQMYLLYDSWSISNSTLCVTFLDKDWNQPQSGQKSCASKGVCCEGNLLASQRTPAEIYKLYDIQYAIEAVCTCAYWLSKAHQKKGLRFACMSQACHIAAICSLYYDVHPHPNETCP